MAQCGMCASLDWSGSEETSWHPSLHLPSLLGVSKDLPTPYMDTWSGWTLVLNIATGRNPRSIILRSPQVTLKLIHGELQSYSFCYWPYRVGGFGKLIQVQLFLPDNVWIFPECCASRLPPCQSNGLIESKLAAAIFDAVLLSVWTRHCQKLWML